MTTRMRKFSMSMNIDGFIRNNRYPHDYRGVFQHGDGRAMGPAEARTYLALEKAKGRSVIPFSAACGNPCQHAENGCTGFDYNGGGCPGRYTEASSVASKDGPTR
ncbi:hypothetical protein QCE47_28065 [Caballeronia sp. LZ025]|uniref:hypothetical protein n=1 Tax=Caballeronia TaxID=1827195 RepID=UPI001FD4C6A8|nr:MULTISPECIES: hypothetical protein [Caballeronia]MDR5736173.1 hypothetical protein [Caballeronia sp. LZ025]